MGDGLGNGCQPLLCPFFDVPAYPVVGSPPVPFEPREKVPAVSRLVGTDCPVAWVDDSITPGAVRWADERRAPTLLVEVDPRPA